MYSSRGVHICQLFLNLAGLAKIQQDNVPLSFGANALSYAAVIVMVNDDLCEQCSLTPL